MMKKVYYLSTCDSNKRILKELNLSKEFVKQEIKANPVNEKELEKLYNYTWDFYIKFDFSLNYDNQPADTGSEFDYVFNSGFGWELK